ncbi:MAG: GNAT family N-acetyltransferase [Actinomycetota bacterium]|nr:GNAT family N-acetyltransferase [Actinomycetota bacterium]
MTPIEPVTLRGAAVTLEPLSADHLDGLVEAASDGELWNLWYTSVPRPEGMAAEIDRRLRLQAAGEMVPFTTRRNSDGRIIGMTTYCGIDRKVPRVEIGYTWNARSVHGTGTNPESKLLLLGHAFDALDCESVCFYTHWMNLQSREAIARLGAKQDGVLRAHQRMPDGSLRDTVVFSILKSEWAQVKMGLQSRLAQRF